MPDAAAGDMDISAIYPIYYRACLAYVNADYPEYIRRQQSIYAALGMMHQSGTLSRPDYLYYRALYTV